MYVRVCMYMYIVCVCRCVYICVCVLYIIMCLLEVTKQLTCMRHAVLVTSFVLLHKAHTYLLLSNFQQISCSAHIGCLMLSCLGTVTICASITCVYVHKWVFFVCAYMHVCICIVSVYPWLLVPSVKSSASVISAAV